MRPQRSTSHLETAIPREDELSDEELSFLQTQKALKDAIAEQKVLRERLKTLETRNKPAKWGQPVLVNSFETARGKADTSSLSPEKLVAEVKTAQHMLENAKRATETARQELKDLQEEMENFKKSSLIESEQVFALNAKHHKEEALNEQNKFHLMKVQWTDDKAQLLSAAEQFSLISHDALHKASQMREQVEGQRKKIQNLASEFRTDLSKSKELRELLDSYKTKVALTDSLIQEIDSNNRKSDQMKTQINEQKMLLRAVRVSQAAKAKLDDLANQTSELNQTKKTAEEALEMAKSELKALEEKEDPLKEQLSVAEANFKKNQMEVLVLEADIRELKSELERMKPLVLNEGRKNVNLMRVFKKKNMDATAKYLSMHCQDIYLPDKIAQTLQNVSESLDMTANNSVLPPLGIKR